MSTNDVFQEPIHGYLRLSATTLALKIRRLEVGVEELMQVFIDRINVVNAGINAVVVDRFSEALQEAKEIDEMLLEMSEEERNELEGSKPFLGIPFTAKEAFAVTGLPNSGGLVARKDYIAQEDAVVVHRLRQAGAIPLALTNCSELCMWWESANRVYGRTCNPFDITKIVGGSSGGEGAIIGAAGSVIGVGSGKMCTAQFDPGHIKSVDPIHFLIKESSVWKSSCPGSNITATNKMDIFRWLVPGVLQSF